MRAFFSHFSKDKDVNYTTSSKEIIFFTLRLLIPQKVVLQLETDTFTGENCNLLIL